MILAELILFTVWAFFPWLGDDYSNYLVLISRPELAVAFSIEPIPLAFIFMIDFLGLGQGWFFTLHAIVAVVFFRKINFLINNISAFKRTTKYFIILMICLLLIGPGISIVRQSVSAIILFYAIMTYLLSNTGRSVVVSIAYVLLASLFHYSAFPVGLFLVIFAVACKRKSYPYSILIVSGLTVLFVLLSYQIVKMGSHDSIYGSHLGSRADVHQISIVFILTTGVYSIFSVLSVLMLFRSEESTQMTRMLVFCSLVLIVSVGFKIVASQYLIFNRLVFYFNPFLILNVGILFDKVKQQWAPHIFGIIMLLILFSIILIKRGYI